MREHAKTLEGANRRLIKAHRHKPIFHEGEPSDALYRVEEGCVRLQVESAEGEREVVSFLFPGQIFCAGFDVHWASAYAVTDTTLSAFGISAVWDHLAQNPTAAIELLQESDALLNDMAHHLTLCHARASSRLRWFVRWLAVRVGQDANGQVPLPMSRRDIADFLGIAPETVSRTFAVLEGRGELSRPPGQRAVQLSNGRTRDRSYRGHRE